MMKMLAVRQHEFGDPDVLTFDDVDVPNPLPTEVQVKVSYAGVNPVDGKVRRGASAAGAMGSFPFIVGWDFAGVVSKVGVGVTRFSPGDRVFGMPWFPRPCGAYAEYVTAPSRQLAKVPDSLVLARAATVPLPATTAWQLLVDVAAVQPGQVVVVLGASGTVGQFTVQIAKALGATVIGTGGSAHVELLQSLGVDRVVDYQHEDVSSIASDADVVIDLVGGDFGAKALDIVNPAGMVVSVPSGEKVKLEERADALGIRLAGIIVEPDRLALESVCQLIDLGQLQVAMPTIMDIADVVEAHRQLEAGASKMVLKVAGD